MNKLLITTLALLGLSANIYADNNEQKMCAASISPEQVKEVKSIGLDAINARALSNDPRSVNILGALHLTGNLVDKDLGKGFEYIKKAAELGRPGAIKALPSLYFCGTGVAKDISKGIKSLELYVDYLAGPSEPGEKPVRSKYTDSYFNEGLSLVKWYNYSQDEYYQDKFLFLLDELINSARISTEIFQYTKSGVLWDSSSEEFNSKEEYKSGQYSKYKYFFTTYSELLNIRAKEEFKRLGGNKLIIKNDKTIQTLDKSYKGGKPSGVWTARYPNGQIFAKIRFSDVSTYNDGVSIIEISDIEVRYPNKGNTIKYKGSIFASKLMTAKHRDGGIINYPIWDFVSNYYNEAGARINNIPTEVQITDRNTGDTYKFPWYDK
jgi:antitoxin component YwqK of YwqJK toxin-antitoxin module